MNKGITSAFKRVAFDSDSMSYIILKGCWYDNTVLNIHAPTREKLEHL
jgi:hypothetical protein